MAATKGSNRTPFRLLRSPRTRRILAALVAIEIAMAILVYVRECRSLWTARNRITSATAPSDPWLKVYVPGVVRPPIVRADESDMAGDDEVIGVVVGGHARAYRLGALADRSRHVVNDLIGATPVSVTYCDLSNCVRLYTDSRPGRPLDIAVGGLLNGQNMVLKAGDDHFLQESGTAIGPGAAGRPFPFESLASTRTTWREWLRQHPDTEVYTGPAPDRRK